MSSITLDGIVAAILTAVTLYSFGGLWIGISLLVFFVLGSVINRFNNSQKKTQKVYKNQVTLGIGNRFYVIHYLQVFCSGYRFSFLIIIYYYSHSQSFQLQPRILFLQKSAC